MAIESQNIYKNARKSAGFTQEKASQLLNVSVDSLRDYEQSQRPVPSDVASAMCDVYQAPYLAVQHLRLTSDLGKRVVPEIQLKDLPEAVLGVLAAVQRFCAKRETMVEIAADGQIAESEQAEWDEIMRLANDLNVAMRHQAKHPWCYAKRLLDQAAAQHVTTFAEWEKTHIKNKGNRVDRETPSGNNILGLTDSLGRIKRRPFKKQDVPQGKGGDSNGE